jgi:hypothetical protein
VEFSISSCLNLRSLVTTTLTFFLGRRLRHVSKRQPTFRRDVRDDLRLRRRLSFDRRSDASRHQQKRDADGDAKKTSRFKHPIQVQGPRPQSNVRRKSTFVILSMTLEAAA